MNEKLLTVIVVDDDESVRRAMKRLLMSNGYSVVTFESAEDLLLSRLARDEICLLLDIRLPGMSGLDLYARLVSSGVTCPVVFVTAHDGSLWMERAKEAGALGKTAVPPAGAGGTNAVAWPLFEKEIRSERFAPPAFIIPANRHERRSQRGMKAISHHSGGGRGLEEMA